MESGIDPSRRGPMPARTFKLTPSWRARRRAASRRVCATLVYLHGRFAWDAVCFLRCRGWNRRVDIRRVSDSFDVRWSRWATCLLRLWGDAENRAGGVYRMLDGALMLSFRMINWDFCGSRGGRR